MALDKTTNSVVTDEDLQTNIPGVFSCGNSRNLVDFVDSVSQQGELAGKNAARLIHGGAMEPWTEQSREQQHHGMPKAGAVICPLCPNGCEVVLHGDEAEGNACPRGADFARQERQTPVRMLTTTVRTKDGRLLPVRTDRAIQKELLLAAVELCRRQAALESCVAGDVIAAGVLGSGADIVACAEAR